MRRLTSILIDAMIVVAVAGCGSPLMKESVAANNLVSQPVPPGKARIYVMRISSGLPLLATKVRDGDRAIGSLRQNRYLCWEREPGEVLIRSSSAPWLKVIEEKEDIYELPLTVEAGQAYYLMQQWRTTKPVARLAVLDEEYARQKLAECKRVMVDGE